MKKLLSLLLLVPLLANAVQNASFPTRIVLANQNVGSLWIVMIGTTAKAVKGLYMSSSAADSLGSYHDVQVGIASSTAPANSEVPQLIVPSGVASPGIFIPLSTQGQVRISVQGIDAATLIQGEIILNTVYY